MFSTLDEIRAAVKNGACVHFQNGAYVVKHHYSRILDKDVFEVVCSINGSCVGLNDFNFRRPNEFYTLDEEA